MIDDTYQPFTKSIVNGPLNKPDDGSKPSNQC